VSEDRARAWVDVPCRCLRTIEGDDGSSGRESRVRTTTDGQALSIAVGLDEDARVPLGKAALLRARGGKGESGEEGEEGKHDGRTL
jgi:hypothetical protein